MWSRRCVVMMDHAWNFLSASSPFQRITANACLQDFDFCNRDWNNELRSVTQSVWKKQLLLMRENEGSQGLCRQNESLLSFKMTAGLLVHKRWAGATGIQALGRIKVASNKDVASIPSGNLLAIPHLYQLYQTTIMVGTPSSLTTYICKNTSIGWQPYPKWLDWDKSKCLKLWHNSRNRIHFSFIMEQTWRAENEICLLTSVHVGSVGDVDVGLRSWHPGQHRLKWRLRAAILSSFTLCEDSLRVEHLTNTKKGASWPVSTFLQADDFSSVFWVARRTEIANHLTLPITSLNVWTRSSVVRALDMSSSSVQGLNISFRHPSYSHLQTRKLAH